MFAVTIGCRQGVAPEGHEILAQLSVGLAAKRLEIIAQGFSPGLAGPTSALKAPAARYAGAIRRGNIGFVVQQHFRAAK